MGLFSRFFSWGKSEVHSALDKMEDPIKMTEQGIRDLRKDLTSSINSLAEIKALAIRSKREAFEQKRLAQDYEKKALILLKKAKSGSLDQTEAERLASEALVKKESAIKNVVVHEQAQTQHEGSVAQMEAQVKKLRTQIESWDNELNTLKARAKVAHSMQRMNQKLAKTDASSTISMLERMRDRVTESEALAESYGDIASEGSSIDQQIDTAISSGSHESVSSSLEDLKKRIG